MAETAAAGKGIGATLGKKVGPLPLGIWLAAGGGLYLYFRHQQQAAASASNPAATQSQTGYGTDPAGNTGYIDPQSGYVYGSAEDIAALQNQGLVGANQYATGGGTGATSGVGATADQTGAAGSTTPSGTATSTPGSPAPATPQSFPPAGGGGKTWHYPAPQGLAASGVSDSGYQVSWSPVTGPAGQRPQTYTVATYQTNGVKVDQQVVGGTSARVYGAGGKGLHPGWQYKTDVWANGGPVAPPHASVVVTVKPKGQK